MLVVCSRVWSMATRDGWRYMDRRKITQPGRWNPFGKLGLKLHPRYVHLNVAYVTKVPNVSIFRKFPPIIIN